MSAPKNKLFVFRFINMLSEFSGYISAVLLLGIAVIVTYEVIMRYVFTSPTTWVQESSVYMWVAIGMLGMSYTLKNNGHFGITILVDKLSDRNRHRLQLVTSIFGLCYALSFVYYGYWQTSLSYELEDVSTGLMAMPLWIPWALVPIGGSLLSLQFINKIVDEFNSQL